MNYLARFLHKVGLAQAMLVAWRICSFWVADDGLVFQIFAIWHGQRPFLIMLIRKVTIFWWIILSKIWNIVQRYLMKKSRGIENGRFGMVMLVHIGMSQAWGTQKQVTFIQGLALLLPSFGSLWHALPSIFESVTFRVLLWLDVCKSCNMGIRSFFP